ncbi:MAG: right-handed parallel beta-helix repeat-containing protein [Proteobacteria bacterium]|jgi:hypothetical protein|nr:right-handed parallel beta-helix repeat-containing protein [Pseudomonadota bacterium]
MRFWNLTTVGSLALAGPAPPAATHPLTPVAKDPILVLLLSLVLGCRSTDSDPAHCADGLYNAGEEGLDCGWTCPSSCKFVEKSGYLSQDETWSKNVLVDDYVVVPEGVTLTVAPGTVVKFRHLRDYRSSAHTGLTIYGDIVAEGTAESMTWFTSAAESPINGDWMGISVEGSQNSSFGYVIVEYSQMGIEQFDSNTPVKNSIIRWANAEGLYAERSTPTFEQNRLYGNGYHEIALEQYNEVQILNNLIEDGNYGIHHEKTVSHIEGNHFRNEGFGAITAGMDSQITVVGNKFEGLGEEDIHLDPNVTATIEDNDFGDGSVDSPSLPQGDLKNFELPYIPGDPDDQYAYIFAEKDETRRVVAKVGEGLYFGWALTEANGYLWRFTLGSGELGDSLDFVRIDTATDEQQKYRNDEIMNPRGLVWDGQSFWVNDFSLLKVFEFVVDGTAIEVLSTFDIPDKEHGGTAGMATDGQYMYLRSRDGTKLYKLNKAGQTVGEVVFAEEGIGSAVTWTGEHFWTSGGCMKGICKWKPDGTLAGQIYPAAEGTWAMTWDGTHLWTIQRTCEMWDDRKVYQIEVLDDSLD